MSGRLALAGLTALYVAVETAWLVFLGWLLVSLLSGFNPEKLLTALSFN